ncbi:MAG: hypothetical protein SFV51_23265 [Bryobacteraceae bacterium]|nr:hypothetical protein [Bryobacteraceae bacterium]
MSDLEKQLRDCLARRQPPPDFAGRVMARLPLERRPPVPWMRWAGALAALLAVTAVGLEYRDYRQGERAKEQLVLALEIAAEKLALVERKVSEGRK